jgi:hypothetical protein
MQPHDLGRVLTGLSLRAEGLNSFFQARGWETEQDLADGIEADLSKLAKRVQRRVEKVGPEDPEYARWHPSRRGDFVGVHSGVRFWPLDPHPDEVLVIDIAWPLAGRPRWNGHGNRWYSIAEHIIRVANVVRFFAESEGWAPEMIELAYAYGRLHDAAEAYLPDLPSPIKRLIPEWPDLENKIQETIHAAFGLGAMPPEIEHLVERADRFIRWCEARELFTVAQMHDWGIELPPGLVVSPELEGAARGDDPDPNEEDEGRRRLASALTNSLTELKREAEEKRPKVPCCNCGKIPAGPTLFPNGNLLTFIKVRLPVPCGREPKCEGWNHELCGTCYRGSLGKFEAEAQVPTAPTPKPRARASWANEQATASTAMPERASRMLAESADGPAIDLEEHARKLGLQAKPQRPGIEREVLSNELDARECVNDPTHATHPCNKGCPRYACLECDSGGLCKACATLEAEKKKAEETCEHGRPMSYGCCCPHGRADKESCPRCRSST